jgi:cytolysin-activating lysine-acyltransferase
LPPVVLDQCRLFTRANLPTAFFSWAFVNDEIDAKLRAGGRLAPHEWKSGQNAWLIDIVMPFRVEEELIDEVLKTALAGHVVKAMVPDTAGGGKLTLRTWPAITANTTQH